MSKTYFPGKRKAIAVWTTAALLSLPLAAHADEREDLEKLRATVLSLIDTLVKTGILPRDKADAMMRDAQRRATEVLAQAPPPEVGADGKKIVRVPYVPEAVRVQMREQIKAEVLAQTRGEAPNWGAPAAPGVKSAEATEARSRLQIEADMRLRAESIRPTSDNTAAKLVSIGNPDVTRAPDIWSNTAFNTQQHQDRTRVRARMGFNYEVADGVDAGMSITTGSTTGPTSTNQTMATGASQSPGFFNKYGAVIDKAFIKYEPFKGTSLSGGRIRNPFIATDLVWADDLSFEGFALAWKAPSGTLLDSFATAGWFPLAFTAPGQSRHRDLLALQTGFNWQLGVKENRLKVAAALYAYSGIEGVKETTTDKSLVPDYVLRSEYGAGFRQRGNTLFRINTNSFYDSATNWGLASGFRELDLTASLDVAQFDPLHVIVSGDIVRNLAFDRGAMQRRTGMNIQDGSAIGYMAKVQIGAPVVKVAGDWNVSLAYRRLGSDAVLDAFTNSDFGLGGTNNKGFTLGANLGLARNTWLGARWMSSEALDSLVPVVRSNSSKTKFSIDTFQFDLNTRF